MRFSAKGFAPMTSGFWALTLVVCAGAGVDADNLAPPNPGNNFGNPPIGPYTLKLVEIDVVYVGEHPGGGGAGVPEPTGMALAMTSLVLVMIRRNRQSLGCVGPRNVTEKS